MTRYLESDDLDVLQALLEADQPLPAHALSRATHLPAAQVSTALTRLAHAGCALDRHPQHGTRLIEASLNCWSEYIESRSHRFGRRTLVYRRTASTQDIARRLIAGAADPADFDGYLVTADHQTAGRGRLGRQWRSRPGDQLLLTAVLADRAHPTDRLMLAAAVAVSRCVETWLARPVELRWPNDVYVRGAKLAGMLVEAVSGAALVGIGINTRHAPDASHIGYAATALHDHAGPVDRLALLARLADALSDAMQWTDDALTDYWRDRAGLLQQRVTVVSDGRELTGRVVDIDPSHGLVFEVERGPIVMLPAASTSVTAAAGVA